MDDFEPEEMQDLLAILVETGRLTAKCSRCGVSVTPEQCDAQACTTCGPFVAHGDPQPVYTLPN